MAQPALEYSAMTDDELVQHARSGQRDAFRAIMKRYNQRLFRVARAVVNGDDEAEDVVQESYVRALTGLHAFRGESGLPTWLTAITLNEARGRLRKRRTMVTMDDVESEGNTIVPFPGHLPPSDPEQEAERSQARALLERAIDSLPPDFRLVFVLRDIEGNSVEETAAYLGIKPQTVKTRLHRARQTLRATLEAKLASGLDSVFPFLGKRCDRIVERVLGRLTPDADSKTF